MTSFVCCAGGVGGGGGGGGLGIVQIKELISTRSASCGTHLQYGFEVGPGPYFQVHA